MSASPPKISVVMPVYNAERFLDEAIESVLGQTYRNFELLIFDDGSTDGSRERIARFRDERIRLQINERNLGLVATLNRGLDRARGDLVARMDADDVSLPERFERQVAAFAQHPDLVLCCTNAVSISERGEPLGPPWFVFDTDVAWDLVFSPTVAHSSVMLSRSKLGELRYASTRAEDIGLWRELFGHGRFLRLPQVLVKYRVHVSSMHQKSPVPAETAALESARKLMQRLVSPVQADDLVVLTRHYWALPRDARPDVRPPLPRLELAGSALALAYCRLGETAHPAARLVDEVRLRMLSYCFLPNGRFAGTAAPVRLGRAAMEWLLSLGPLSLLGTAAAYLLYRLRRMVRRLA